MTDQHKQNLEDVFPDDLNKVDLKKTVRRARRISVFRNVMISVVVSIAVIGGGLFLNNELLAHTERNLRAAAFLDAETHQPDVFLGNSHTTYGLFGGQEQYQLFKVINGVPISWGTETYSFNVLGQYSLMGGDYSPAPQLQRPNGTRVYNYQTQQRLMEFYYPGVTYPHYFNDLSQLNEIPSGDSVEMAISFEKSYTFNQVTAMLPTGVHTAWYWVDTYDNNTVQAMKQSPDTALMPYQVYGFGNQANPGDSVSRTPQFFIQLLQAGLKLKGVARDQYQQIFNVLSHGQGSITPADVKIIGVVVTGTPHDLEALQGQKFVKASVLGAIANPYHS